MRRISRHRNIIIKQHHQNNASRMKYCSNAIARLNSDGRCRQRGFFGFTKRTRNRLADHVEFYRRHYVRFSRFRVLFLFFSTKNPVYCIRRVRSVYPYLKKIIKDFVCYCFDNVQRYYTIMLRYCTMCKYHISVIPVLMILFSWKLINDNIITLRHVNRV